MMLYVLVPTAVYDHGVIGVFSTLERARTAAEDIWPTTDGHHAFRIDVVDLDHAYPDVFQHTAWFDEVQERMDRDRAKTRNGGEVIILENEDRAYDAS